MLIEAMVAKNKKVLTGRCAALTQKKNMLQ
jgi:hypothetical protein